MHLTWLRQKSTALFITKQFKASDGLVQDVSNSSAKALQLLKSCTKPHISYGYGLIVDLLKLVGFECVVRPEFRNDYPHDIYQKYGINL